MFQSSENWISKKEGSFGATLVLGSVIGGTWTKLDHINLLLICLLPRWFEKMIFLFSGTFTGTADGSEIEETTCYCKLYAWKPFKNGIFNSLDMQDSLSRTLLHQQQHVIMSKRIHPGNLEKCLKRDILKRKVDFQPSSCRAIVFISGGCIIPSK